MVTTQPLIERTLQTCVRVNW